MANETDDTKVSDFERQGTLADKILYVDTQPLQLSSIVNHAKLATPFRVDAAVYKPSAEKLKEADRFGITTVFDTTKEVADYVIEQGYNGVVIGNSLGGGGYGDPERFGPEVATLLKQKNFSGSVAIVHNRYQEIDKDPLVTSGAIIGNYDRGDMINVRQPERSALVAVTKSIEAARDSGRIV